MPSNNARTVDVASKTNNHSEPLIDERTVKADGRDHDGQISGIETVVDEAVSELTGKWRRDE